MELLVAIVARSGAGKSHAVSLVSKEPNITELESYTTRLPRHRGEHGHIFVDPNCFTFDDGIVIEHTGLLPDKRDAIAYTFFDGEHYWAERNQVTNTDGVILYVIDPTGVKELRKNIHPEDLLIINLINVPVETCVERMIESRGTKHAIRRAEHDSMAFQYSYSDINIDGSLTDVEIADYIKQAIAEKKSDKIKGLIKSSGYHPCFLCGGVVKQTAEYLDIWVDLECTRCGATINYKTGDKDEAK